MKDFQGNFGSYDLTALPNLVSLLYQNKNPHLAKTQQYSVKKKVADKLDSDSVINDRWEFDETFHNAADKQQLSRHVKQTVEYIDLFYPTTLLRNSQPTLTALHARESSPCFVICEKT